MDNQTPSNSGNCSPPLTLLEQIHKHIDACTDWFNAEKRIYASVMIQGVHRGKEFQHLVTWKADQVPDELITFFASYGDRLYSQKIIVEHDGSLVIPSQTAKHG